MEVRSRRFPTFFDNQNEYSKSSLQSLGNVYVVSILQKQVLRIHTTLKSIWRKFEQYTGSISALMYGNDRAVSCSANLFHRLLKDTTLHAPSWYPVTLRGRAEDIPIVSTGSQELNNYEVLDW